MRLNRLARALGVTLTTCAAIGLSTAGASQAEPAQAPAPAPQAAGPNCEPQSYCGWDQPNYTASNPNGGESGLAPKGYCREALNGGSRSAVNYTSVPVTFWEDPDCGGASYQIPPGGVQPDFGFVAKGVS